MLHGRDDAKLISVQNIRQIANLKHHNLRFLGELPPTFFPFLRRCVTIVSCNDFLIVISLPFSFSFEGKKDYKTATT